MIEIIESATYKAWFAGLKDRHARARIDSRIRRLSLGNAGDVKPAGEGLSELRIDYGPGYRVYFLRRGAYVIVLLGGGSKRSQTADIKAAKQVAAEWRR